MILFKVRDLIRYRKQLSLLEIAALVNAEASAVEGMLDQWIKRGLIGKSCLTKDIICNINNCSGCQTIINSNIKIYFWKDEKEKEILDN